MLVAVIEKKNEKADAIKQQLELHNAPLQKIPKRAIFFFASAAIMLGTSQFSTGCMEKQHVCYFGVDLRN